MRLNNSCGKYEAIHELNAVNIIAQCLTDK